MDEPGTSPQIGRIDVDREALGGTGSALSTLVAELGASVGPSAPSDAPADGWRVLRRGEHGGVLIGAPEGTDPATWRLAHVETSTGVVHVQPVPARLRPSRAERRAGLRLAWPSHSLDDSGHYAVDVVNAGEQPWLPDGDSFHAFGVLTDRGAADVTLGWAAGADESAVALAPGEYARVPLRIDSKVWQSLEPGEYDLHGFLVDLDLRTPSPLTVSLSASAIAQRRAASEHRRSAADEARLLEKRIATIRQQLAAGESLVALAEALRESGDTAEDVSAIGRILGYDDDAARSVYNSPLGQLSRANAASLRLQLDELVRRGKSA